MNSAFRSTLFHSRLAFASMLTSLALCGPAQADSPFPTRSTAAAPTQTAPAPATAPAPKQGLTREEVLRELKRAQDDGTMREIRRRRVYTTS